jgi:hypothetical protein
MRTECNIEREEEIVFWLKNCLKYECCLIDIYQKYVYSKCNLSAC